MTFRGFALLQSELVRFRTYERLALNSSNSKSDWHLISPHNVSLESHMELMRIKEMVTREGTF